MSNRLDMTRCGHSSPSIAILGDDLARVLAAVLRRVLGDADDAIDSTGHVGLGLVLGHSQMTKGTSLGR